MYLIVLASVALALPPGASLQTQCDYGDPSACAGTPSFPQVARTACEDGDTAACGAAVVQLRHAPPTERDDAWALAQAAAACEAGAPAGCLNAAWFHREGRATKPDLDVAFTLYRRACELGALHGCCEVAGAQRWGRGTKLDAEASVRTYRAACGEGAACGCRGVALRQAEGRGVERDRAAAESAWQELCTNGDAESCSELGSRLFRGEDEADVARGRELLSSACDAGMTGACARLDDMDVDQHAARCDAGHSRSCVSQGKAILDTDEDGALELFEQACEMGSSEACRRAGALLGQRMPEGGAFGPRGVELYARAAAMGDARSGFYLGRRYERGNGVPHDRDAAVAWLSAACADEWVDACTMLAEMHRDGALEPEGLEAGSAHLAAPCRAGNLDACEQWGTLMTPAQTQAGLGDPACIDAEVTQALRRACEAGRGSACYRLSVRLHIPFFEELDAVGAFEAARAGCAEDYSTACVHAAWHWDHGTTVVDRAEAARAVERACELNEDLCPLVDLRAWSLKLHDMTGGWL